MIMIPAIFEDESLASFAYRAAYTNFCHSVSAITPKRYYKISKINDNCPDEEMLNHLTLLTGIDFSSLYEMTYGPDLEVLGTSMLKKCLRVEKVKYCPMCVVEKLYHRKKWLYRQINVCTKHRVYLVSCCHQCQSHINMSSLMNDRCSNCNYTLSNAQVRLVFQDSVILQSQKDLMMLYDTRGGFYEKIVLAQHSFHLLQGLRSFIDEEETTINAFYTNQKGGSNIKDMAIAYANVFWMYINFPSNFYKVLDKVHERYSSSYGEQKRKFEKLFKLPLYGDIQNAYNQYWVEQVDRGNCTKNVSVFRKDASLLTEREFLTQSEAVQYTSLNTSQLALLIQNYKIEHRRIQRGDAVDIAILKTDLDVAMEEECQYMTPNKVCEQLGISNSVLKAIVDAGLLSQGGSPLNRWKYDNRKIIRFIKDYCFYSDEKPKQVELLAAVDHYKSLGCTLSKLFGLIRDRKVKLYIHRGRKPLEGACVNEGELQTVFFDKKTMHQETLGYTAQDLTKLLNISIHTLNRLMELGILIPEKTDVNSRGHLLHRFNKKQIDEFIFHHPTFDRASQDYNISKKDLRSWRFSGELSDPFHGVSKIMRVNAVELQRVIKSKE